MDVRVLRSGVNFCLGVVLPLRIFSMAAFRWRPRRLGPASSKGRHPQSFHTNGRAGWQCVC